MKRLPFVILLCLLALPLLGAYQINGVSTGNPQATTDGMVWHLPTLMSTVLTPYVNSGGLGSYNYGLAFSVLKPGTMYGTKAWYNATGGRSTTTRFSLWRNSDGAKVATVDVVTSVASIVTATFTTPIRFTMDGAGGTERVGGLYFVTYWDTVLSGRRYDYVSRITSGVSIGPATVYATPQLNGVIMMHDLGRQAAGDAVPAATDATFAAFIAPWFVPDPT